MDTEWTEVQVQVVEAFYKTVKVKVPASLKDEEGIRLWLEQQKGTIPYRELLDPTNTFGVEGDDVGSAMDYEFRIDIHQKEEE